MLASSFHAAIEVFTLFEDLNVFYLGLQYLFIKLWSIKIKE